MGKRGDHKMQKEKSFFVVLVVLAVCGRWFIVVVSVVLLVGRIAPSLVMRFSGGRVPTAKWRGSCSWSKLTDQDPGCLEDWGVRSSEQRGTDEEAKEWSYN